MQGRYVTAAMTAVVVAALCAGCSGSGKVTEKTARITVDNNTRTLHAITCNQVQWLLTADILVAPPANPEAPPASVQVMLDLKPDKPKLKSVNFNNFAGFTGVADTAADDAKTAFANGKYTISGTATGSQLNDRRVSFETPFKIEVGC